MPGKAMPAAALSLANNSPGPPAGWSAMLAAAASQLTCATEMRGGFHLLGGDRAPNEQRQANKYGPFQSASHVLRRQPRVGKNPGVS